MKRSSAKQQGLYFCWTLLFVMTVYFIRVSSGQPQVYFKAVVPAKSLPRIGRRSEIKVLPGDPFDDLFHYYYPPSPHKNDRNSGDVAGQSLLFQHIIGQEESRPENPNRFIHFE